MFKNWFLLASVSCGVGFGSTFLISRNLQQSTLAGLVTVPAVAASLTVLSRQRREEIERQVAKSRLGLDDAQEQLAKAQLQLKESSCREISEHRQELQTLQQAISRNREKKIELERDINSLVLKKQTGESLLVQLDAKVLDKQKQLQTTNVKLAQIQAQGQLAIDSGRQSNLQLQSIHEQIRQDSATRKQLQDQITDLQNRSQSFQTILADKGVDLRGIEYQISQMEERRNQVSIEIADLDRLLQQKRSLISKSQDNLDSIAIASVQIEARKQSAINSAQRFELTLTNIKEKIRQDSAIKEELKVEITNLKNQETSLRAEIATYKVDLSEIKQEIFVLKKEQEKILIAINKLNRSIEKQQFLLDDLNLEIWNQQQIKENIHSEITELENSISLFSVHTTVQVLNIRIADLYRRWQEVSQQVSQLEDEENESSIIAPAPAIEPEPLITTEEWESHLINNPYLPVFQHIDKWGSITAEDVNNTLGNARIGRQFNREFREYYQYLPFSIRVETSNNSIRYVKEIITVSTPQNLLYIPQPEIVDHHTETEQYISEPEYNIIQDLNSNDESQSDDYVAERIIHIYPVCLFCERSPIPGQDRCAQCN